MEIPSPVVGLKERWQLKLRKGSDEGEVVTLTSLISNSEEEIKIILNTNGIERILKQKGYFIKEYWEIESVINGNEIYTWEKDSKIKHSFILVNSNKVELANWSSTKFSSTQEGQLKIDPIAAKEVELILTSALVLEEIIRRKPQLDVAGSFGNAFMATAVGFQP